MGEDRDAALMARALRLAARGLHTTHPNPRVGCVIARDGDIVGEGFHAIAGGDHAEVVALRAAGECARGATAYVTLEPCCHHGRTPPCTGALIEAGIARVVCALRDPNPRVTGRGMAELREAGISVDMDDRFAPQARLLNVGFIKRMASGRPWIRVKLATSLDGRTALASGESRWITGEPARADVHRWRARSSCILTGRGTVASDDPRLDVRLGGGAGDRPPGLPWVVIADSRLRTPASARLFDLHQQVVIFTVEPDAPAAAALRDRGAEIVALSPDPAGGVDLAALFRELGRREANEVHVEAGPTLCGRLLATGHVDELLLYLAPQLLGDTARGAFTIPALASMDDRIRLHVREVRHVGRDLRIQALPIVDHA